LGEKEYLMNQDYLIRVTEDGREELWGWGDDSPSAVNQTQMSWFSPGYPEEDSFRRSVLRVPRR